MPEDAGRRELVRRLIELHVVRSDDGSLGTTRRFRAAMARAAADLVRRNEERFDLRIPVAAALLELHAAGADRSQADQELTDEELTSLVELVLPIEARELAWREPPPPP